MSELFQKPFLNLVFSGLIGPAIAVDLAGNGIEMKGGILMTINDIPVIFGDWWDDED